MSKIEINKAGISELNIIQKISIQTFTDTFAAVNTEENMAIYIRDNFNLEKIISEINNPDSVFYIATFENETVGYLKINFGNAQTEKQKEKTLEIHRIYVLETFHGKKIGQSLLDEAIRIANESALDSIWLGVWEENHKALYFYAKNGFVEFDKHIFILGDEVQTDLLMQLDITKQLN
jgi:ribosomal protein S18 acetylase RimI-like enzyme